jgi:hypothetical protein
MCLITSASVLALPPAKGAFKTKVGASNGGTARDHTGVFDCEFECGCTSTVSAVSCVCTSIGYDGANRSVGALFTRELDLSLRARVRRELRARMCKHLYWRER